MRSPALFWLVASSVVVAGCTRAPESYPPPEQHRRFLSKGLPSSEFLRMADPDIRRAVVKDVNTDEASPWKWTGPDPELRFRLPSVEDWTLLVEFVINERTFKDTGPVNISFHVNDRLVGEERYASPGEKKFEASIPPDWLRGSDEQRVRLHIDPVWPANGLKLGVLLQRVGFVE